MTLFQCSFYSKILATTTKVMVLLPAPRSREAQAMTLDEMYEKKQPYQVLYLLHGMNGDETVWLRKTNLERYVQDTNLAVVMPYGENSYYTNMVHGCSYFDFLTEELPRFIKSNFFISDKREDTFIAGLSMGGYGACKAAFTKPEKYSAFANLSGAVDIEWMVKLAPDMKMSHLVENIFGKETDFETNENNLFYLAKQLKQSGKQIPDCYIACGTEDEQCYGMNIKLKNYLETLFFPIRYMEEKGGHEWDFWDSQIQFVIRWLLKERGSR